MTCRKLKTEIDDVRNSILVSSEITTSNFSISDHIYRFFHNARLMKLLCFNFSFWKISKNEIWINRNKLIKISVRLFDNERLSYIDVAKIVFSFRLLIHAHESKILTYVFHTNVSSLTSIERKCWYFVWINHLFSKKLWDCASESLDRFVLSL